MKELTLSTLLAVFEEVFGPALFWALVALAVIGLIAFLYVLFRERTLASGRFLRSEIVGVIGGFAAIWFVQTMTSSGYGDIGGPIDLIILALIWIAGAVGTVMVAYTLQGLLFSNTKA
ncbi:DUF5368 domain-containing protein [Cohaesibacter intestini]|uniref:DUF5368 domain-containing protein n=1 Tax=Cohaesibacter intestini TaxID=2211145 RepID=UPI000DE98410|nr:DUF5368 domain-containing protein [Cohaesibacter intestini]